MQQMIQVRRIVNLLSSNGLQSLRMPGISYFRYGSGRKRAHRETCLYVKSEKSRALTVKHLSLKARDGNQCIEWSTDLKNEDVLTVNSYQEGQDQCAMIGKSKKSSAQSPLIRSGVAAITQKCYHSEEWRKSLVYTHLQDLRLLST